MLFKKISKVIIGQNKNQVFEFDCNNRYAIFDGGSLLVVDEENMTIEYIPLDEHFELTYTGDWVHHPLFSDDWSNVLSGSAGEDLSQYDDDKDYDEMLIENGEIETTKLLSLIDDFEFEKDNTFKEKKIQIKSFGGLKYDLTVGYTTTASGHTKPYLQLSVPIIVNSKEKKNLGINLNLTKSNVVKILNEIKLINSKIQKEYKKSIANKKNNAS